MNIPATSAVLLEHSGAISQIRFNRPEALNTIDRDMAWAFLAACREVAARPASRVLVLSGEGRTFMAGVDLPQTLAAPDLVIGELIEPMNQAIQLLSELDIPVLGSLQGPIAGAGMSIALACDLAIAATSCRFNFACLQTGIGCQLGASWHLPRLVGLRAAMELALLNEPLKASQAAAIGLVNRIVPLDKLASETWCLAKRLSEAAIPAQGQLKRLMRDSYQNNLAQQLEAEKRALTDCLESDECRRAARAYLDKYPAANG
jgi:2-(1,2-epoxy-1,2-dihydrophenyl)acetyl-CoA isomerase